MIYIFAVFSNIHLNCALHIWGLKVLYFVVAVRDLHVSVGSGVVCSTSIHSLGLQHFCFPVAVPPLLKLYKRKKT